MVCDVEIQEDQMEEVHAFKYLGCRVNYKDTEKVEYKNKLINGRKIAGAIKGSVFERKLSLEYARVFNENLLIPTLVIRETMVWKVRKRIRGYRWISLEH